MSLHKRYTPVRKNRGVAQLINYRVIATMYFICCVCSLRILLFLSDSAVRTGPIFFQIW